MTSSQRTIDHKQVFTTGEVARFCNVAPRTVAVWFNQGRLSGYRIPGSNDRRFQRQAVLQFLRDNGMPIPAALRAAACSVLTVGLDAAFIQALSEILDLTDFGQRHASCAVEAGLLAAAEWPGVLVCDLSALGREVSSQVADYLRRGSPCYQPLYAVALVPEDEAATTTEPPPCWFDAVLVRDTAAAMALVRLIHASRPRMPMRGTGTSRNGH